MGDLTVPLKLIAQSWFRSNRAIFTLKGPGKYADLSPAYKAFKARHLGTAYPIMRLSGQVEQSITDPTDPNSISYILNKNHLVLGTSIEYANINAKGSKKNNLPARPVVLFGNESVAPGPLNARVEAWKKMLLSYVGDVSGAKTDGKV